MGSRRAVFGVYAHLDRALAGIAAVRGSGFNTFRVFSPTPNHRLAEAIGGKSSPVRAFTLAGGLTGLAVGWAITLGPLANFHLHVGGKPLASIPPFAVVAYICTIFFGAVATLVGMVLNMRLPRATLTTGYDPRLSSDHYGIRVVCEPADEEAIVRLLKSSGAVAINTLPE